MPRVTDFVLRHRLFVVLAWVALAAAGLATVGTTTGRLTMSFALPGQPGYETNARIDEIYHNGGAKEAIVATVTLPAGETTASADLGRIFAAAAAGPGELRLLDQATTGDPAFATADHRTGYALIFTPSSSGGPALAPGVAERLRAAAPAGWRTGVTGIGPLTAAGRSDSGAGLLVELLFGAAGALLVLAFVFASFLAVLPLLMAAVAVPTTFLLVLGLTTLTDVSSVVQFLIALIGLGVAIDYALLVVTRWREARDSGADNVAAVREAMNTAGRAVVLSGVTVAISLLALALLPVPYLRSIGFAGFFIPLISIAVAVTLLPVILAAVGPRLDHPRLRHEGQVSRVWTGWGRLVVRRRWVAAVTGLALAGLLIVPFFALRIGSPVSSALSRSGPAHTALTELTSGGVPSGVLTPIEVLTTDTAVDSVTAKLAAVPGVRLAAAPDDPAYRRAGTAVIDVLPVDETSTPAGRATIDRIQAIRAGDPGILGVGGTGAEDMDFSTAVYGNFGYVLAAIAVIIIVLLTRALRSIVLAVKAVVLNLISVGAAYGVIVFVWQQGHGSTALWGVPATGSITVWVPMAMFAFLFGLSMDYEVFILTRMREAYDETGSTTAAIVTGIGRTGRLVTSAALILCLAFVSLASGPEVNIKILATGLGAGILIDAVVVRTLLVPAFVSLLGRWNWYLPGWMATVLRVAPRGPLDGPADQADRQDGPAGEQAIEEDGGGGRGRGGAGGGERHDQAGLDDADAARR